MKSVESSCRLSIGKGPKWTSESVKMRIKGVPGRRLVSTQREVFDSDWLERFGDMHEMKSKSRHSKEIREQAICFDCEKDRVPATKIRTRSMYVQQDFHCQRVKVLFANSRKVID